MKELIEWLEADLKDMRDTQNRLQELNDPNEGVLNRIRGIIIGLETAKEKIKDLLYEEAARGKTEEKTDG